MNSDYCVKLHENDDVYVAIKQIPEVFFWMKKIILQRLV